MAKRVCFNCGKGIMRGNTVSHSKQRTKRLFKPNLKSCKIYIKGVRKKVLLCTKCLKTLKKKMSPKKFVKPEKEPKKQASKAKTV